VKYELGFYIPEDDILHSHRRENFKSYILLFVACDLKGRLPLAVTVGAPDVGWSAMGLQLRPCSKFKFPPSFSERICGNGVGEKPE
jgi:hypothetical protein